MFSVQMKLCVGSVSKSSHGKSEEKEGLNETVSKMVLEAPMIAKKAQPGQFVIVRAKKESERIPLTIADYDRKRNGDHHLSDQ